MLRVLSLLPQALVIALASYDVVISFFGWWVPPPAGRSPRRRRLRVVVPAHDEATVIVDLLRDLSAQDHPRDRYEVVVVADRCSDDTTAVARPWARVEERTTGQPGKGAAIADHLRRRPLAADEALVVLDADNRVPAQLLGRFADELEAGHEVLQAYLDVSNPDASLVATANALTYWASNRTVQLARRNLGWSCDLGGTGMCISARALADAGGFLPSLTEDQDLAARLVLAGHRIVWLHDVRVRDEKPTQPVATARQRGRWMAGKRQVARRAVLPLLEHALRTRSMGAADLAIRIARPGRSFVALLTSVLGLTAWTTRSPLLLSWRLWSAVAVVQVAYPIPFLVRDGVPARYLAKYPAVAFFGLLWLPARVLSRFQRGWYHTKHLGRAGGGGLAQGDHTPGR